MLVLDALLRLPILNGGGVVVVDIFLGLIPGGGPIKLSDGVKFLLLLLLLETVIDAEGVGDVVFALVGGGGGGGGVKVEVSMPP